MLIGTVIMSFDLNQIYEDPHSYDVYNPDLSLSSVLAGSDQFGPVMCPSDTSAMWYPSDTSAMWCPSDTSATLQHLPPPNEPPLHFQDFFAPQWNELPNNQPQKNVNHTIVLPGMSSHTSQCPLVLKLEPIRCLFVKDWVLACERKSRAHFSDDVVELVDSLIDPRKICHKKPEELKAIMRSVLTKEEVNKVIDKRRKLLRKINKRKPYTSVHKQPCPPVTQSLPY